ncbi:secretion protein EccC [Parafrankia colletiae]|uniref:Secretion protein EccC n=1 Tax=Parafrankia colletiae TaxID=573497 RepID=A0A1S1QC85_9ACTN|nr:type VII secretion protein EccCa [Parafrankia colletiae]MCK9904852.1 type VII secretion protein EccCa [Frankia sp. Cpl3]OHV30835.1 secretion protein EccC [Parafrankia colletiae]
MPTVAFRRPARRVGPEMPHGDITLQEPPAVPEVQSTGMRALVYIIPGMLMSGGMMFAFMGRSMSGGFGLAMMCVMVLGMGAMGATHMVTQSGDRRQKIGGERRDYLRYLSRTRREVRGYAEKQRAALAWRHPEPESLWSVAMTSRLWERRPAHPDFGEVRVGTGTQRLAVRITPLQTSPVEDLEPVCAKALRRFTRAYTTVPRQPVALFVRGFARLRVDGPREHALGVVRALLAQLVTFHAPDELRLAVAAAPDRAEEWGWVKWLPHAQHPADRDAAGPVRVFGESLEDVERLLGRDFGERARFESGATPSQTEPYVVVVSDGGRIPAGSRFLDSGYRNAVLIDFDAHGGGDARRVLHLDVTAEEIHTVERDRVGREVRTRLAAPDLLSRTRATTLARLTARHSAGENAERADDGLTRDQDLADLLGLGDLERFDAKARWAAGGQGSGRLRVPIGVAADGSPIELDIKESAEDGMGPHGMLIGATGSGKSELLRTLVLALAVTHSSETLNLVLVDFKGGATFAGLDRLPHVSATITNLADQASMVDRMRDALHGELIRRQELLRAAGNFSSARDYEQARAAGAALEPLPTLFVVIDEFSELIAAHTEFIDLFVMIGRLGRSLAVHLLLASQRLDEGRVHQIEGHLSYRIVLRTFSAMESRAVIGVPDAYELPASPGSGYLRSDVATITRFKAAYVSGPYRLRSTRVRQEVIESQVLRYDTAFAPVVVRESAPEQEPEAGRPGGGGGPGANTVLQVLVDRLVGQGPPAHQVWLPPLEQAPTLDQVLPPLLPDPDHGLRPVDDTGVGGRLRVPVGVIDKPFEQIRDLLMIDLGGVGGHLGIAGGPQSGKSTLLRTLVCALALTHSPREVQFFGLDFGGGSLTGIADLPHVGGVTGRHDPDRVNRTVAEALAVLTDRERRFADLGVTGMADYRAAVAAGRVPEEEFGDLFLVVDGWFTLRQEFEQAEEGAREIAARGLNYGVHLLLTAGRWSELHHSMRDKLGSRLELRLGDPVESGIDLRAAAAVPRIPGHGITDTKLHFLAALPRIDGSSSVDDLAHGTRHLVSAVEDCWPGPRSRTVRTLPAVLPVTDLPAPEGALRVALGVDESRLEPVWHDFEALTHLTVLGDDESGKTNLLRLLVRAITTRMTPAQARIMAVDYRRRLFDDIPEAYRLGYSVSSDSTTATVKEAVAGLTPRLPGADITPEQLRSRDWWRGPRLFVLVDDYDLLTGADNPLARLVPLLPQGGDIGLHVVLTRAAAGVMRMSMDPVLRRLQELNTPDLAFSCPRGEGPLLGGTKPRTLPPGRALLCTRRGSRLIQTGHVPVDAGAGADADAGGDPRR